MLEGKRLKHIQNLYGKAIYTCTACFEVWSMRSTLDYMQRASKDIQHNHTRKSANFRSIGKFNVLVHKSH